MFPYSSAWQLCKAVEDLFSLSMLTRFLLLQDKIVLIWIRGSGRGTKANLKKNQLSKIIKDYFSSYLRALTKLSQWFYISRFHIPCFTVNLCRSNQKYQIHQHTPVVICRGFCLLSKFIVINCSLACLKPYFNLSILCPFKYFIYLIFSLSTASFQTAHITEDSFSSWMFWHWAPIQVRPTTYTKATCTWYTVTHWSQESKHEVIHNKNTILS